MGAWGVRSTGHGHRLVHDEAPGLWLPGLAGWRDSSPSVARVRHGVGSCQLACCSPFSVRMCSTRSPNVSGSQVARHSSLVQLASFSVTRTRMVPRVPQSGHVLWGCQGGWSQPVVVRAQVHQRRMS